MYANEEKRPSLLKQIDHIGIAVNNLEQSLAIYKRLFQAKPDHFEVIEEHSVRIAFISVGEVMLELLEPSVSGKGHLREFIEKHGEGVHHLAYRVDKIDEIVADLKKRDVKLRDENVSTGAGGSRIIFISSEETGNVLTELVETSDQ